VIAATIIPEPDLEFGCAGRQVEQRRGVMLHGPADVEMEARKGEMHVGVVGPTAFVQELVDWLTACAKGVDAKQVALRGPLPRLPRVQPHARVPYRAETAEGSATAPRQTATAADPGRH
jgi:hypothetical protein